LRERGRRESNLGAEIMVRAAGSISFGGGSPFVMPATRASEIEKIEGVRAATAIGQTLDRSDTGFGTRLIDGIDFDGYAKLTSITLREGSKPVSGDEAIVDPIW